MENIDYLKMLREIKSVTMATTDRKGFPKARIIDIMFVENESIYFCTARGKEFYHELIESERVAIVAMTKNHQTVRLNGKVIHLTNQKKYIDRIFEENPGMNEVYPGDARYILEPFCVNSGTLEYFDLSTTPIIRSYCSIGDSICPQAGFEIEKNCIACGLCFDECPQKCIQPGPIYKISQTHCLHCGLCYENCPVKAVKKRGEPC